MGGLAADGAQAAVVQHRRRAGAAGAAQAHSAALPAAAAALATEQAGRRQLGRRPPRLSQPGTESSARAPPERWAHNDADATRITSPFFYFYVYFYTTME